MTIPATLIDRAKRTFAGIERRLDNVERGQNAQELRVPTERTPDGDLRLKRDWSIPGMPTEPPEPAEKLEMADLEPLGRVFGFFFLRDADREIRIDGEVLPASLNDMQRDKRRVFVHELVKIKGEIKSLGDRLVPTLDHTIDRFYRGMVVPVGTFERERARFERAEAARQPRLVPVLSDRPAAWPLGRDLLLWLKGEGVELAMVDGRLVATRMRRSHVLPQMAAAIRDHAELLVGWLTDAPVTCWRSGCDTEAVTVLLGGAPACGEHAR
jgi:hypothetical protein